MVSHPAIFVHFLSMPGHNYSTWAVSMRVSGDQSKLQAQHFTSFSAISDLFRLVDQPVGTG